MATTEWQDVGMNSEEKAQLQAIYDVTVNKIFDRVFAFCGSNGVYGLRPLEYQGFSAGSTADSLKVLESGRYALWFQGYGNEPIQEKLLLNDSVLIYSGDIGSQTYNDGTKNLGESPSEATLVTSGTTTEPWVFDIDANTEITAKCTRSGGSFVALYIYKVE